MKFIHPEIETVIDTENGCYNTLVIEEQAFFTRLLLDLQQQLQGAEGQSVLSVDNTPIPIGKNAMVVDAFVPFDLNRKQLLNRLVSVLAQRANAPENMEKTAAILSNVELWLDEVAMDLSCDIIFEGLSSAALIKASSPEIRGNTDSVAEMVLDLIELVEELDRPRLFFLVNMRSYVTDQEMEAFLQSVLSHGYHVIGIESSSRPYLSLEKRVTIDADLCEIS